MRGCLTYRDCGAKPSHPPQRHNTATAVFCKGWQRLRDLNIYGSVTRDGFLRQQNTATRRGPP